MTRSARRTTHEIKCMQRLDAKYHLLTRNSGYVKWYIEFERVDPLTGGVRWTAHCDAAILGRINGPTEVTGLADDETSAREMSYNAIEALTRLFAGKR